MERPRFYKETATRLGNVQRRLDSVDANADIQIMGVGHFGDPRKVLASVADADVITMELTRRVVDAGIEGTDEKVFNNSRFWNQLVLGLRDMKEGKRIKGIEVNQAPRVAWKRFNLHRDIPTLGPSIFSVEVPPKFKTALQDFLKPEEQEAFDSHGWVITNDVRMATFVISGLITEALRETNETKTMPLELSNGLLLVSYNDKATPKQREGTTFIAPPHPSLEEALAQIKNKLEHAPIKLTEPEADEIAMYALLSYMLAPVELTEAEEIAYATNRFLRTDRLGDKKQIKTVHIGGAAHAQTVADILTTCLPEDRTKISVRVANDPRINTPYVGSIYAFFKDHVPFVDQMSSVHVKPSDVSVDVGKISVHIDTAVGNHSEDFEKRVVVDRIVEKKYPYQHGFARFRSSFRERARLYRKSLKDLKDTL